MGAKAFATLILGGYLLISPALPGEFAVDAHTRFLCHFNDSLVADFARGDPNPSWHAILTRGNAGRFGEAAALMRGMTAYSLIPAGSGVAYGRKDNWPVGEEGTIEFFLKIFKLSREARNSFFACGEDNAHRITIFCDPNRKDFSKSRLWFWVNNNPDPKTRTGYVAVGFLIAKLLDRKWHHVAASWDSDYVYLALDGQIQAKTKKRIVFPTANDGKLRFGLPQSYSRTSWLLDEIRISDICRYRGDIPKAKTDSTR